MVRDRVLWTVDPVTSLDPDGSSPTVTGGIVDALAAVWDCNGNNVKDETDIANETSDDCTGNGTPDECEPDCNANSVAGSCDIDDLTSEDCNSNGVPDECDCETPVVLDVCNVDCNSNSIYDFCDIDGGSSQDCDGNGVPDECDPDCDGDGVPDDCDPGCCVHAECGSGELCCNYQCETGECCDDSDCTIPLKFLCRTSNHTCVVCLSDADCGPNKCCTVSGTCSSFACGQYLWGP